LFFQHSSASLRCSGVKSIAACLMASTITG
jgi:hypothetical protein